jgi:rhomboid-like protein
MPIGSLFRAFASRVPSSRTPRVAGQAPSRFASALGAAWSKPSARRGAILLSVAGIGAPLASSLRDMRNEDEEATSWGWGSDESPLATGRSETDALRTRSATTPAASSIGTADPFDSPRPIAHLSRDLDEEIRRAVEEAFGGGRGSPSFPTPPHPPPSSFPPRPYTADNPYERQQTAQRLVAGIIGINAAVWAAWQVPYASVQRIMERYFITSPHHMGKGAGRGVTSALGSTYSHKSFFHLAANMVGLWSFGPRLMEGRDTQQFPRLSPAAFVSLYTVSGVGAAIASNTFMAALALPRPGLGASGSIFALLTYYGLARPDSRVLFLFFIDMSAISALGLATIINGYLVFAEVRAARMRKAGPAIDGLAHLVGTGFGAAAYYAARARARRKGLPAGGGGGGGGSAGASGGGGGMRMQHPAPLPPQQSYPPPRPGSGIAV